MAPKAAAAKAALAAYGPDMSDDCIKCLVCGEGSRTFASWTQLKKHLLRQHPLTSKDIKGTYIQQKTMAVPEMTQAEYNLCGPVAGSENDFWCKTCNKKLGKANAYRHLLKHQESQEEKEAVKSFVIVKDNWKVQNSGLSAFTLSYNNFTPAPADDEGVAADMGHGGIEPGEEAAMDLEGDLDNMLEQGMEADGGQDAETPPGSILFFLPPSSTFPLPSPPPLPKNQIFPGSPMNIDALGPPPPQGPAPAGSMPPFLILSSPLPPPPPKKKDTTRKPHAK